MKTKILLSTAFALAAAGLAAAPRYEVFLLGGQSELAGRGTLTDSNRLSTERVLKLSKDLTWVEGTEPIHFDKRSAGAGPAASFARAVADHDPDVVVCLVPCAFGGTSIRQWQPGQALYTNFVARAREAAKRGPVKGFLWHQGDSDANAEGLPQYLELFTNAITSLRRELAIEDVPFLAGELGTYHAKGNRPDGKPTLLWQKMNATIAKGVKLMPNAALVKSDRLIDVKADGTHWETPSVRKLGERYAAAYFERAYGTYTVKFENDHPNLVYAVGDEVKFKVTVSNKGRAKPFVGAVSAQVDNFGTTVVVPWRTFNLREGGTFEIAAKAEKPGFLRLQVKTASCTKIRSVAVSPEKIRPGRPAPADLAAFWDAAIKSYDASVPDDVKMEPMPALDNTACQVYKVSLTVPFGRRMWGTLSIPRDRSRRYPLQLAVPGAGPSRWSPSSKGNVAYFMMNVHYYKPTFGSAYPNNQVLQKKEDDEWQAKFGATRYCRAGISEGRETYFYYAAILGIRRAFMWAARQEWADPDDVTYSGTSQGGGFGLFMTALVPGIRKSVIYVPAITGHYAFENDGAQAGWPALIDGQRDAAASERAKLYAGYFDGAAFATLIKTPIRFVVGFADVTCAPHAVYSAYNECASSDKEIWHGLDMTHSVDRNLYKRGDDWQLAK